MRKLALALGLALAAAGSVAPASAETKGLGFRPVAPEGLDAAAMQIVATLQERLPAQLGMYEAAGYGYYGAFAVPQGTELKPETAVDWLAMQVNSDTAEEAKTAVLESCAAQTHATCTVIGLLVPAAE